jgi:RNA recognition motif-containing protein
MAQSAIRNLHGFEFGGRSLRVDKASSQADELRLLHQQTTIGTPAFEPAQSANITPDKVPEVIARTIGIIKTKLLFSNLIFFTCFFKLIFHLNKWLI